MLELNLFSPKIKEIQAQKHLLIRALEDQGIKQFDYFTNELWFVRNANQHLSLVIEECQDSIREGFLTPLTNKSQAPLFTIDMFVDEIVDAIQYIHLNLIEIEESMKTKQNQLDMLRDLYTIEGKNQDQRIQIFLAQNNDDDQIKKNSLQINTQYLEERIELSFLDQITLKFDDEIVNIDILELLLNKEPLDLLNQEIYRELIIQMKEIHFQLLFVFEIALNKCLFDKLMYILENQLTSFRQTIKIKEDHINQLLVPFQNFRYSFYKGLYQKHISRNLCCAIF